MERKRATIDSLTPEALRALAAQKNGPAVSLMLPTHRVGDATEQDPIRLKNLVGDAERALQHRGCRPPEARVLLEPIRTLLDDRAFWQHQEEGLAVFANASGARAYRVPRALPEVARVGDAFYLKPLLGLFHGPDGFYVLAFSQKNVRLFAASRRTMRELDLGDAPRTLEDVVGHDWEQKSQEFRGVYHGHGTAGDEHVHKREIERFLHAVDAGVRAALPDANAPLVVAAVGEIAAAFRGLTKYPRVVDEIVEGNPDGVDPRDLHARAWRLVEPIAHAARERGAEEFATSVGTGLASADPPTVARAARAGRVYRLYVAEDSPAETGADGADAADDDAELVAEAATEAWLRGADVWVLPADEVPGGGSLAAVFRY